MLLKLYLIISGGIFFLVGTFHLLRLIYQWNIIVGTSLIPQELSYAGCPVSFLYFLCAVWLLVHRVKKKVLMNLKIYFFFFSLFHTQVIYEKTYNNCFCSVATSFSSWKNSTNEIGFSH
jgi:hypothetical protein